MRIVAFSPRSRLTANLMRRENGNGQDIPPNPPQWNLTSDHRYIWSGNTLAEERDSTGATITKRFFAEGEQINGVNYYFTRDHLGSVREMTTATGTLNTRYDYDPYGKRTTVTFGTVDSDLGFTGHYFHAPSGLNLTLNRAYDPVHGRWLSRDPLENAEMSQGPNLYAYVGNNPVNETDPLGLCPGDWWDLLEQFMLGSEEGAYASIDSAIPFWDPFASQYNRDHSGVEFSYRVGGPALETILHRVLIARSDFKIAPGRRPFDPHKANRLAGRAVITRATIWAAFAS